MDKLDELLKYCEQEKKWYENPSAYMSREYYETCRAKSDMLSVLIEKIKELKNDIPILH